MKIGLGTKKGGGPSLIPGSEIPWRRKWQSASVFLPGESHGERSLADYSPWAGKESDKTEWLSFILTQGISMDIFQEDFQTLT